VSTLNLKQQVVYDIWKFLKIDDEHYELICNILNKLEIHELIAILPKEERKKFESYIVNS
jgi:DNA-binding PadR family transcriptional regulator